MRSEGWELRLAAEIEAACERPWQWGAHDCATFCGRCVRAMGPHPLLREWMGRHSTRIGAARVLAHEGVSDLAELMDSRLDRIDPRRAQRGDIGALRVSRDGAPAEDGEPALGVFDGPDIVCARWPAGTMRLRRSRAFAAWKLE